MSKIHDRLIDARIQGHSWAAINDHMADAFASGATREQLGYAPSQGLTDRMHFSIAGEMPGGGVQVAAGAANDNSPYAWTRGKAPVGALEGFLGGGGGMGGPRVSAPAAAAKGGAVVTTPSSTGPGSMYRARQGEWGAGDYPPNANVKYENAVREQRGGANDNAKPSEGIGGKRSEAPLDMEKKQFSSNEYVSNVENALTGVSQPKESGMKAVREDALIHLNEKAIGAMDEQN